MIGAQPGPAREMSAVARPAHRFVSYVFGCLGKEIPPGSRHMRQLSRKVAIGMALLRLGPECDWDPRRLSEQIPASRGMLAKMIRRVGTGPVNLAFIPIHDADERRLLACIDDCIVVPMGLKDLRGSLEQVGFDEVALVSDPDELVRRFREALVRRNDRGVAPISRLTPAQLRGARHCWLGRALDDEIPLGDLLGPELGEAADNGSIVCIDMTSVNGMPFTCLVLLGRIIDFVPDFETEEAIALLLQRLELRTGKRALAVVRDSGAGYDSLSVLTHMGFQGSVPVVVLSANDSPADKSFRNERRHLSASDLRSPNATLKTMRALANANWDALVPQAMLIPSLPAHSDGARYRAFRVVPNRGGRVSVDGYTITLSEDAPRYVLVGIRTVEPLAVGRSCRAVAEVLRVVMDLPDLDGDLRTLGDGLTEIRVIGSAEGVYLRRLSGNRFRAGTGTDRVDGPPDDDTSDRLLRSLGMHRVREKRKRRSPENPEGPGGGGGGCGLPDPPPNDPNETDGSADDPTAEPVLKPPDDDDQDRDVPGPLQPPDDSRGDQPKDKDADSEGDGAEATEPSADPPPPIKPTSGMFPGPGEQLLVAAGNDPREVDLWRRFAPLAPALMRWRGTDLEGAGKARIAWERARPVRVLASSSADRPALLHELIEYLSDAAVGPHSSRRMAELLDRAESVIIEMGESSGVNLSGLQDTVREARTEVAKGHLETASRLARAAAGAIRRLRS